MNHRPNNDPNTMTDEDRRFPRTLESRRGRWITQPLDGILDASLQRLALDLVSIAAAAALTLEFVYLLYTDKSIETAMQITFWLGLASFVSVPIVVRASGSNAPGALIVLAAFAGLIIVPAYYQGGASALFTLWFLLVPLLAGLLLGHRIALIMGSFGVSMMTGLFVLEGRGQLPHPAVLMDPVPAWLNLVFAIGFSAAVGAILARTLTTSSSHLKAAKLSDAAKTRALEEAIEGIARVGQDGRLQTVNPAFAAMHESTVEDLIGTAANDWILEEDRKEIATCVLALAEHGRQEVTVRGKRSDGASFFENMFLIAVPNQETGDHYRFARDVTRQRELTEQLSQSVKMDAIGRLAGGIAHDFNNLLMTILTASDRLKTPIHQLPEPNSGREFLSWIDSAAQRGAALTRQLLDFSHVKTSDSGPIDVHQSLHRLIGMLDSVFGASIRVESDLCETQLICFGDLARFESGLMNLAVNARDAMPNGGSLRFRTSECNLDPKSPRFAAFRLETERFARIDVIDDGAGIDSSILDDIFDPFFTTKPVGKGTGLGLSLFYTYTRELGGALEIESAPDQGTMASIYLPLSDTPPPPKSETVETRLGGDETILLAEDEPIVAALLAVVLSDAGFRVITSGDGREALENFQKHRDGVDLVLLDYRMPFLNGIEVFDAIHEVDPDLPVVLMSGNIASSQVQELEERGLKAILGKPCSGGELLKSVRKAIDASPEPI
ncbi:response regulator [Myxococcota bacterium]|nr:response regulator [Myxococcota bacterium]